MLIKTTLSLLKLSLISLFLLLSLGACTGGDDGDPVPINAAFELLASKSGVGIKDADEAAKAVALENVLQAIIATLEQRGFINLMTGLQSERAVLEFPTVDTNRDGVGDEVGRMIEVSIRDDFKLLEAGNRFGIILPWPIVAYTDSVNDAIHIVAVVPETWVRTYLRGVPNLQGLIDQAVNHRIGIERTVATALKPLGFSIENRALDESPLLGETQIAQLEQKFGALTPAFSAPTIRVEGGFSALEVAMALQAGIAADQVPDLDGDGVAGQAGDDQVLPNTVNAFLQGQITKAEFSAFLAQGETLWKQGGTFQDWRLIRALALQTNEGELSILLEACHPYYAGIALSLGIHHMPALPCRISVWEEDDAVYVNLRNTLFLFGYFWSDVELDPNDPMAQLFAVLPSLMYNEMAAMVNVPLAQLGVPAEDRLSVRSLPSL